MKIDTLNKWLTLAANIGVVIGIAALIIEIKQNTRSIEVEAIWARTASGQENQRYFLEDPDALKWLVKFRNDPEGFEQLLANDDIEAWKARVWVRMLHLNFQARYQTLDSDSQRAKLLEVIRNTYTRFPFTVTAVNSLGLDIWDEDFRQILEELLSEYE